ncbi:MAG: carboxylate-amine ligase [Armatimonadota bacterium]
MMSQDNQVAPASPEPAEGMHRRLMDQCSQLMREVEFVRPRDAKQSTDRLTRVRLTASQTDASCARMNAYKVWLMDFIGRNRHYLAKSDINLLEANAEEIGTYVLMQRTGQDVTDEMYQTFYQNELNDLVEQQQTLCALVMGRSHQSNMAARRRHWFSTPLTIGVEEELQIIAVEDGELAHDADLILENTALSQFGREVYQSQIEVKTPVCDTVSDVSARLYALRAQLRESLPDGRMVLAAGAHPFSQWNEQLANRSARTALFIHDMQDIVRRLVTFGLHVHIGVTDEELRVKICNAARRFLPVLLALSCSSPFWNRRVTGVSSYRSTVFSALPRTGIPPTFANAFEFHQYCELLARTNSFDSEGNDDATKIWWDLRLHPSHPTLEFRICDACTNLNDAVCIAALCQAIVAKLAKLFHEGVQLDNPPKHIIEENKWRAVRYGHKARFIDERTRQEVTMRYVVAELLDFVADVLPDLGSEEQIRHVTRIVDDGCSAHKQLLHYSQNHDMMDVIRWLGEQYLPEHQA